MDALKQFSETEEWRKENELDQLYETIDLEHYEETRRLVKPPFSTFIGTPPNFLDIVPAMDRTTRSTWYSCIRIRSIIFDWQANVCI